MATAKTTEKASDFVEVSSSDLDAADLLTAEWLSANEESQDETPAASIIGGHADWRYYWVPNPAPAEIVQNLKAWGYRPCEATENVAKAGFPAASGTLWRCPRTLHRARLDREIQAQVRSESRAEKGKKMLARILSGDLDIERLLAGRGISG